MPLCCHQCLILPMPLLFQIYLHIKGKDILSRQTLKQCPKHNQKDKSITCSKYVQTSSMNYSCPPILHLKVTSWITTDQMMYYINSICFDKHIYHVSSLWKQDKQILKVNQKYKWVAQDTNYRILPFQIIARDHEK